jgi:hypothetical protein
MPPATIADVCARLKEAQELLRDPNNWKRADELIDEARALLRPISGQSPRTVAAWTALAEIGPLVSPAAGNDCEWTIETAKGFLEVAIGALCSEAAG